MKTYRHLYLTLFIALAAILLAGLLPAFGVLGQDGTPPASPDAASPDAVGVALGSDFTYQGYLQQGGAPVDNVACDLYFALWDEITGGNQLGTQTLYGVNVNEGVFTVQLDFGNIFTGSGVWLETAVQCPDDTGYTTLLPRQSITAVPYALSLRPGAVVSSPSTEAVGLSVYANDAPNQIALYGEANQTDSVAVYGNSENNTAVFGNSGTGRGVWGQSTDGEGVYGYSVDHYGVHGESDASNQAGVQGLNNAISGIGVRGEAHSNGGVGVYGYSLNAAVYGESTDGKGVWGQSSQGTAIYGTTTIGTGVWGTNGGSNTVGYAGYFDGRVVVIGNLSKSGGSFTIDHPLDPENMYLQHSFVESPDMMNVYNGNITLDETGEAWVTLPDWFEELNRDFRYQLTAVGAPGPNLYIAETVKDNQFKIAGGTPGMTVSWQITGIRHDPWADANRIEVELQKDEADQGRYLHPEAYGLPREEGIAAEYEAGRPTITEQQSAIGD